MNREIRRSLVAAVAGPVLAAGLFLTTVPAQAVAAVGDSTCGNNMAMPQTKAASGAPSIMTRAGQVAASTSAQGSGATMGSACPTAGHA